MDDPNTIQAIKMITEQIDHSAWWICFWLFVIAINIPSTLGIKKDDE